jgi:hypothetical protein
MELIVGTLQWKPSPATTWKRQRNGWKRLENVEKSLLRKAETMDRKIVNCNNCHRLCWIFGNTSTKDYLCKRCEMKRYCEKEDREEKKDGNKDPRLSDSNDYPGLI